MHRNGHTHSLLIVSTYDCHCELRACAETLFSASVQCQKGRVSLIKGHGHKNLMRALTRASSYKTVIASPPFKPFLRPWLTHWLHRRKATKRELLSLVGRLAFAARAVPAGRLFLCRLITLSTKVRCLHHHLRLTKEARADILWWHSFLPSWNGTAAFLELGNY